MRRNPIDRKTGWPATFVASASRPRMTLPKLGIPKTSMLRARAGISYALLRAVKNGDCGLPAEDLLTMAEPLLEIGRDTLSEALRHEIGEGSVVVEPTDGRPCVFLPYPRRAEDAIAAAAQLDGTPVAERCQTRRV